MHISSNINVPPILNQTGLSTESISSKKDVSFSDIFSETSSIDQESKTDKNSLENIQNWILGKSTIEPDEEALINALYSKNLKHTGSYICNCTLPDGSNFYYPPITASMEEKKSYVDSVKNLTSTERFDVATLLQEKFGIKLTYRAFQRVNPDQLSSKELWDSIISDLTNALASSKPNDPNYDFFLSGLNSFRKIKEHYQNSSTKD